MLFLGLIIDLGNHNGLRLLGDVHVGQIGPVSPPALPLLEFTMTAEETIDVGTALFTQTTLFGAIFKLIIAPTITATFLGKTGTFFAYSAGA